MLQIDLFCRVIDNYGDIGVCWRLARQLVAERGCAVRLIVDDLASFRVIAPEVRADLPMQRSLGVEILAWHEAESLNPAPVVIEAFACDPPAAYVEAMAEQAKAGRPPVWINLEYLSAETWVDDVHGLPSQHQRLPLTKYFFCPGFTEASGGLIREQSVADAVMPTVTATKAPSPSGGGLGWGIVASENIRKDLHAVYPHPTPPPLGEGTKAIHLLAFTYPHAPVRALAQAFAFANRPVDVTLAAPLTDADPSWQAATPVAQTGFDALLAPFDVLVVRGEDSFVRAQWAAKPFLWHIYPTADDAHMIKLDAWLERYCIGLEPSVDAVYRAASRAFNRAETAPGPYAALASVLPQLTTHAAHWRDSLMQQTDLASRLLRFCDLVKSQKLG